MFLTRRRLVPISSALTWLIKCFACSPISTPTSTIIVFFIFIINMGWFWNDSSQSTKAGSPAPPSLSSSTSQPQEPKTASCPVDHQARQDWLDAAKSKSVQTMPHPTPSIPLTRSGSESCDSTIIDQSSSSQSSRLHPSNSSLSNHRQISSIPRGSSHPYSTSDSPCPSPHPPNAEQDPKTSSSGHWIYPSEAQFFAAMRRKSHNPSPTDMKTIVPIHNAVNEKVWHEILKWEAGRGAEGCGGPKLVSFRGDSTRLTPRARWNVLLGYQAPFDRHDWVVDRCGMRVDYVIDFYQGKADDSPQPLSFYLDVRPKLNTWEGVRMRLESFVGL
jgi:cytochrome c heme-lyase